MSVLRRATAKDRATAQPHAPSVVLPWIRFFSHQEIAQREVLQSRLPAMLPRGDVIEMKRQLRDRLRKAAVFATMRSPLSNRPLLCLIHAIAQQTAARRDSHAFALSSSSARPTFR